MRRAARNLTLILTLVATTGTLLLGAVEASAQWGKCEASKSAKQMAACKACDNMKKILGRVKGGELRMSSHSIGHGVVIELDAVGAETLAWVHEVANRMTDSLGYSAEKAKEEYCETCLTHVEAMARSVRDKVLTDQGALLVMTSEDPTVIAGLQDFAAFSQRLVSDVFESLTQAWSWFGDASLSSAATPLDRSRHHSCDPAHRDLGLLGLNVVRRAERSHRELVEASAALAGDLAVTRLEHELTDTFHRHQERFLFSRLQSEQAFQKELQFVYLTTDLLYFPNFNSDSELLARHAERGEEPVGNVHKLAHASDPAMAWKQAIQSTLEEHMLSRGQELMGIRRGVTLSLRPAWPTPIAPIRWRARASAGSS